MKTKTISSFVIRHSSFVILLLLLLAGGTQFIASASAAENEFSFVYRGRLDTSRTETLPETVDAVFTLYDEDEAPVWTMTKTVMPGANGVFQCELGGEGLANALASGAKSLGIKLGDGEEQHPRQQILDTPLAERAQFAAALLKNGTAVTVVSTNVVASSARFAGLRVNGPFEVGNDATLQIDTTHVSGTLALKKGNATVSVFRNAEPDAYTFDDGIFTTNILFRTESGGVVTVLSDAGHWNDTDGAAPCVSWPVPPGDVYPLFDLSHPVRVYFYPFGASN